MPASSLRPHRPYSRSQTAHLVPAARFLRPGFAFVTASSSRPGRSARQSAFRTSRDDGSRAAAAGRHSSLRIQVWLVLVWLPKTPPNKGGGAHVIYLVFVL